MEYTIFFWRIHPRISILGRRGFAPRPSLVAIEIHVTIRLGIFVAKNEIYVTIVLEIFLLENYTCPLPRNDPEGMGGHTQPT